MRDGILILGAAGFIGTNLTLRLLQEKKKLFLFERAEAVFAPKVQCAIKQGAAYQVSGSFLENIWQDKLSLLREVDTVYHLISTTCPTNSNRNTAVEIEENLVSTIHFLDACVEAEVPKVVFLSSGGTVYGKEHTGVCREEEEAFPITVYGVQKLGIEKILYLYHHMHGLDYRIVRLSNPYGPYQRPDGVQGAITTFTWRVLRGETIEVYGDGSVVRDYIYIDDAIEGILRIADGQGSFRLYNLGSGTGHSLQEALQVIAKVTEKVPQVIYKAGRPVDVPINILDISRFRQNFGCFEPIGLEEGVRRLVRFYEAEAYNGKDTVN